MENLIRVYYGMGMSYKDIASTLAQRHHVIVGVRHLKRILRKLGIGRRKYDQLADVVMFIQNELRGSGALHGYRMMYAKCTEAGLSVRKEDIRVIMGDLDPLGVETRMARRLVRRSYFALGPNSVWHCDGYDKLKPYGLCVSGCIDGFSRKIIWLNVYNTNNNPRIIGGYYVEAVEKYGGCPRVVRADLGTENVRIKEYQYFFRHADPNNNAERPYIGGTSTHNQRIESWWCFLRRQCAEFWMEVFKGLQHAGDFNGDFLAKSLIQFCFTSLVQVPLYYKNVGCR